ncbi:MAG: TetR/AcrR family transcriptional regulator [Sideroxyarcus sp.]|nr:TetR/AcrR family transcriptional regulator [Sideroxyarcus sp.]
MRVKTDEKRQLIVETAYRLFRANGFDKTSMSEITAQVGGSKATLYNYFSSKEELFVECMFGIAENYLDGIFSHLQDPAGDIRAALQGFGANVTRLICSPEIVAAQRLMIAEAERAGIGNLFYEKINSLQVETAAFIGSAMDAGKLRCGDPRLAAVQLKALMEAEIHDSYLLCVRTTPPDDAEVSALAERAVDCFLRAYAPETE